MSVITWTETPEGQQTSETVGDEITKTRTFDIRVDNPLDDVGVLAVHAACPRQWEPHPNDPRARAQKFTWTRPHKGARTWRLTVEYSSKSVSSGLQNMSREYTPEQQADPLKRPARISCEPVEYQRYVKEMILLDLLDRSKPAGPNESEATNHPLGGTIGSTSEGKCSIAIVTSAGELVQSAIQVDDSRQTIRFTKNIANPLPWMFSFKNVVNNAPVTIDGLTHSTGTLMCKALRISEVMYENDIRFRELSGVIHHKDEGWDFSLADVGKLELVLPKGAVPYKQKQMRDEDGQEPKKPLPLDGKGSKSTDGNHGYTGYRYYKRKSFTQLLPYLS